MTKAREFHDRLLQPPSARCETSCKRRTWLNNEETGAIPVLDPISSHMHNSRHTQWDKKDIQEQPGSRRQQNNMPSNPQSITNQIVGISVPIKPQIFHLHTERPNAMLNLAIVGSTSNTYTKERPPPLELGFDDCPPDAPRVLQILFAGSSSTQRMESTKP